MWVPGVQPSAGSAMEVEWIRVDEFILADVSRTQPSSLREEKEAFACVAAAVAALLLGIGSVGLGLFGAIVFPIVYGMGMLSDANTPGPDGGLLLAALWCVALAVFGALLIKWSVAMLFTRRWSVAGAVFAAIIGLFGLSLCTAVAWSRTANGASPFAAELLVAAGCVLFWTGFVLGSTYRQRPKRIASQGSVLESRVDPLPSEQPGQE